MVTARHTRFTVLTPELIRMEWAEDNQFENHPSLIFLNRNLPVPPFSMTPKDGTLTIHTGKLQLAACHPATDLQRSRCSTPDQEP
jgi:alpha-glucosidase